MEAVVLVSVATDRNAELVVVGARDDRPIAERLLGTVATEVSKQAPCDVSCVVYTPAAALRAHSGPLAMVSSAPWRALSVHELESGEDDDR